MAYCGSCGVSFSDTRTRCPLCGEEGAGERPAAAEAGGTDFPRDRSFLEEVLERQALSRNQKRLIYFEIVSIVFGSALLITLMADILANRGITWSRYSSPPIVWGFLLVGMTGLLGRYPWIVFSILAPTLPLMLLVLDAVDGRLAWFLPLALPLSLWGIACVAGTLGVIAGIRRRGLNVIASALLFTALLCAGIEAIVNLNAGLRPLFGWSPVVALAAVPASGMLFYLHYRIVRQASLKKLFRV